jgi:MFS family permease
LDSFRLLHVCALFLSLSSLDIPLLRTIRTSTSFQLLYGRLSDIWSRKLILLTGLAIFFLGSLASSLSQNVVELIVFRAITGVGGGGLMTVAQIIVSDVVSLRERGKYQGILVSCSLAI